MSKPRRIVGCMTGTSLDGLDCALLEVAGDGLSMHATFVRASSTDLGALKAPLRAIADQTPATARDLSRVLRDFSLLHADAIRLLLHGERCDLICVHGQTVFHQPPLSWQLFQPAPLAHALRTPVVHDLRQADLAAGGQGAPITPIADLVLFQHTEPRTAINLGGFCNLTNLPARGGTTADIAACDVCACNQLLDAIARQFLDSPFDTDGAAAARGSIHEQTREQLADLLRKQLTSRRSLGTGDELASLLNLLPARTGADLARSACEAIADVVLRTPGLCTGTPVLAGGGVRNRTLLQAFTHRDPRTTTTTALGIPAEFREAACFAVLGALCQDRVPITLPQVTHLPRGTPAPLAGAWVFPA